MASFIVIIKIYLMRLISVKVIERLKNYNFNFDSFIIEGFFKIFLNY